MKKKQFLLFITLIGIINTVSANLNEEMAGVFGDLINVTPAGSYNTQRRGVIAGGSISMRTQTMNPNLISFTPPSINAGCGGIDLYGGSFSWINGAQFTQMLRNIAQASGGYAFHLAIEGMCPTCAQVMDKLQDDVNKINAMMKNSCTAAKQIDDMIGVSTAATGIDTYVQNKTAWLLGKQGIVSDWLKPLDPSNATTATQTAAQNGVTNQITGNVIWAALTQSNVQNWFSKNSTNPTQMNQALMSLTGAPILGNNGDGTDVLQYVAPSILNVADFVEGGDVKIYQCESAACLLPGGIKNTKVITLIGMRTRVKDILYGGGTNPGGSGLLNAYYQRKASGIVFSASEKAFIEAANPGALALIRSVGTETGTVGVIGEQLADVLSRTMVKNLIEDMYTAVSRSVALADSPMLGKAMDTMKDVRVQMDSEMKIAADSTEAINVIISVHHNIKESLKNRLQNQTK
ncbi:conjugal transfer protein TraH [Methylomonas sp. AM2-LC]|uniref:conjugal transfer protein TraH n=1 Tax=Methylomonas sp. AM2-LC TaxID=3153301 RepID=UPI00326393B9